MRKLKLFFACLLMAVLSIGQMWAEVVSGTAYDTKAEASIPSDWTAVAEYSTSGGGFAKLTESTYYLQTDEFCQGGFTSIKIKTRKFGTVTGGKEVLTVEWIEKGSATPVELGTITPTSTSLVEYEISSPAIVDPDKLGTIKIYSKKASSGGGAGVQTVTITYTSGNCAVADPYTVSFNTGAGNPAVGSQTEAEGGAGITLPAGPTPACSAAGWEFAGWAAAAVASETTTAPTLLSGTYHPTEDCTLFAVYKRTEAGSGSTTKSMTSFDAISGNVENDENVSYAAAQGTSSTAPAVNSEQIRIYQNGGLLTITANNGVKLNSITIGSGMVTKVTYAVDGGAASGDNDIAKNGTFTVDELDATEVVFTCTGTDKNSRLYLNNLSVTYGGGGTTYYLSAPSCCEKHAINIADGIDNGSVEADLAEACEGTAVTLTFTPATNYHLSGWTLNGVAQDVNANTFSMPAGAATVSATFAQDACDPLATPVVAVSGKAYPYNAVKLAWSAITNADSYKVYIYDAEDNELEHNDAVTGVEYTIGQALSASTTYKYSVQAVSNTPATYCPSTEAENTFTTDALPTAHLTLMNLGEEHASSGDYAILTPFNLPTTAAACSKAFVGWDADPDCATAPTYAKGAEFTFANTTSVTLYAVYADETPGAATLTKLNGSSMPVAGDKIVIVGIDTNDDSKHALYQETSGSSYVKHWTFDNDVATVAADAKKYVTLEAATDGKFYLGDATNGYVYSSGSNNLSVDLTNKTAWTIAWDADASAFTFNQGRYLSCRSDLTGDNTYLYRLAGGTPAGIWKLDVYKYGTSASTFSNYSTTCIAAPEAIVDPEEVNAPAAGVANGVIVAAYENVNEAEVAVALYSNAACTEAFEGSWLTASINGDKNIAYTIAENTSYNDIRTAYIKLTAPETSGAASPAVVVIPVEQAKKPAVFASLAELVAASIATGTEVTVTFANEVITDDHYISQGTKRAGVLLTTKAANDKAIEIFYNKGTTVVPAEWLIGGSLAATAKTFTWTFYNDQWELVPLGNEWTWDNGDLIYTAPKAVSSVVITGAPTKTSYVDGEKFAPAGLTVTVNYNDDSHEENPVGVTFECTPARVAKSENPVSVSVVATFNEVSSEAFPVNVTVGDIQLKTTQEFIAAGNADMRCYLEGIVSDIETGTKLKYGNFNLTDASGTIYVYGCLNQDGEAQKFDELGVQNGDKIKVIAEDYDYYNSKHEAKNVQFVSKTPAATISIDDIDMETGDELALSSIVATITPAAAESATITYEVTEGTAVSISEGKIIANAEGVATITASIAEGVGYLAANTTFTVTVTAPDTRKKATASAFTALSGDMSSTDISFAAYQGDATNAPVVRSGDNPVTIRMYKAASGKSTGGYLTLKAKVGCTIDQVKIEFSGNADAAYCKDAEALPTSKYIEGQSELLTPTDLNAQSVSIVNLKNGSIDVATITVWYNGDPLAVHHYFLGGTYATEFEQYGTFSYEGLTVTAAYDEQETITEPVSGFTVEADLMTAGAKKAYVYLNDVEIAQYDITVNAATKENPALAYTPNVQEIAAEDVASWSAPAFSNTFNVSPITYTSNKTSVATVDENGVIALAGGYGTAIITATFAEDDDYIASVATYTITVNEPVEDLSGTWVVAKSVAAGDRIIIGATYQGNTKTMGAQNDNNRAAVASTLAEGILTPAEGTKTFTLVDAGDGKFAIRALNGKYLTASGTGTKNYLTEADDYTEDNAKWTVSIDNEGVASIVALSNNRNDLQYNNGNTIFSCYATDGQKPVNIYKIGTPDYGSYQRTGLTAGNYGTICLPKAGTIEGATLYSIGSYDGSMIYVDEVGTTLAAGVPYIFQATDDHLTVTYTSATVVETAGSANGLFGFYNLNDEDAQKNLDQNDGNYILYQNQYWLVSGRAAYIANYRAYIKIGEITNAQPAPGIRRVAMQVNGQNTTTGVDNLNAGETPVKVMINGQMYILRGEKMYNANGQLVK